MISVDLSKVSATPRLRADQAALDAADDIGGPSKVKERGGAGWSSLRQQLWEAQHGKCAYAKSSRFDLRPGARRLRPRECRSARFEDALLVDPTRDDPALDITYVFAGGEWRIAAANDSDRGAWTIETLGLDRTTFLKRSNFFIRLAVDPLVAQLNNAIAASDRAEITRRLMELTRPPVQWAQLMRTVVDAVRAGTYP